ncbi:MAG: DUF4145 domain-containing protein [Desulfovibrio sp.]
MYADFGKYNYSLVPENERAQYVQRDKEAYRLVLKKWFEDNLDNIIQRKWEIDDITYLSNISDFIKLLEEAENLYELGFFTSCIALIGVSSEDFTKFLAIQLGHPKLESDNQYNRLKKLEEEQLISNSIHSNLDSIRKIRNDCLHYNNNFKQKEAKELKTDALEATNNFKLIIKELLAEPQSETEKIETLAKISESYAESLADNKTHPVKNLDDMYYKMRNAFSTLFNFPIALSPEVKTIKKHGFFEVVEIDLDFEDQEVTLVNHSDGMIVSVDLLDKDKKILNSEKIQEGDSVQAIIISKISSRGISEVWHFLHLKKIT